MLAGRRTIGAPDELAKLLREHREDQGRAQEEASGDRADKGYVFTKPHGEPLVPNTDYHEWKKLLADAGVRDGRLHDARHTPATVLLLGVPDRMVDAIMGWEPGGVARMCARYMHVITDPVPKPVVEQLGSALWGEVQEGSDGTGGDAAGGNRGGARRRPRPVSRSGPS